MTKLQVNASIGAAMLRLQDAAAILERPQLPVSARREAVELVRDARESLERAMQLAWEAESIGHR